MDDTTTTNRPRGSGDPVRHRGGVAPSWVTPWAWLLVASLAGCAATPSIAPSSDVVPERAPRVAAAFDDPPQPWRPVALPGKRATQYTRVDHDGRAAVLAVSEASASMFRRRLRLEPAGLSTVDFSWQVPALVPAADLADPDRADSPVRVMLAFDGDRSRLSTRNRMMFDLAETLTGEPPPYATLMYVWDNRAPVGTVLAGGRSDRIQKIVVESGAGALGTWRSYRRDVVRDFERAFGEPPGRLIGVAVMTDSDNTASRARAWYGDIVLTDPGGVARRVSD